MKIYMNNAEQRIREASDKSMINIEAAVDALSHRHDLAMQIISWYKQRILIYVYVPRHNRQDDRPAPPPSHCKIISVRTPFTHYEIRQRYVYVHTLVVFPGVESVRIDSLSNMKPYLAQDYLGETDE